jgi:hypothetical protein
MTTRYDWYKSGIGAANFNKHYGARWNDGFAGEDQCKHSSDTAGAPATAGLGCFASAAEKRQAIDKSIMALQAGLPFTGGGRAAGRYWYAFRIGCANNETHLNLPLRAYYSNHHEMHDFGTWVNIFIYVLTKCSLHFIWHTDPL